MALGGHLVDIWEALGAILVISKAMLDEVGSGNRQSGVRIGICEALRRKSSGVVVASGGIWWHMERFGGMAGACLCFAVYCRFLLLV